MIGTLRCFTLRTRSDLAVADGLLASHLQRPANTHSLIAKWALRYLRGVTHYERKVTPDKKTQLTASVDMSKGKEVEKAGRAASGYRL